MALRRVVITGMGVISALGGDRESFWSALAAGRSGTGPIQAAAPASLHFANVAEVRDFEPRRLLPSKVVDLTDRFAQFAIIAAQEALADAGLDRTALTGRSGGVIAGSIGGLCTQDAGYAMLYRDGRQRIHPMTIPKSMPNAAVSHISIIFGVTGPSYAVSAACSSSNFAIGQAFWLIRGGQMDFALTGGSDAPLSFGNLAAWDGLRVVSPDTCRPFSAGRSGMILGEGGAMLLLEDAELAEARGARIYAEIVGFGMASDAHHLVHPLAGGAVVAMQNALKDGSVSPTDVNYINAHGSGTEANDATECEAIRTTFGQHADSVAISSTKSMHGHALGAAGALEAVATVMAIDRQTVPPTAGYLGPDPACNLDVVPNAARACRINAALSNSFAFGGSNAVLAFSRWQA